MKARFFLSALLVCCAALVWGQTASTAQPAAEEWVASFDGNTLDETKWARFSLEGGTGGTFKVEGGQLHLRSVSGSRSGVRTKQKFKADRFIVEATLAKVGLALPESGKTGVPRRSLGNSGTVCRWWPHTSSTLLPSNAGRPQRRKYATPPRA